MATIRHRITLSAALLLAGALSGCGTSNDTAGDTTIAATDTTIASSGSAPSIELAVVIGVDDSPNRVETVAVGTWVSLTVTSPAADEIHVHGVDLEQAVTAGGSVTFTFLADSVGELDVESHETHTVLVVINVV